MKISVTVAGGLVAALGIGTYASPAQADAKLSSAELVPAVTNVGDVRAFYRNAVNEQRPRPGTGSHYIPDQGICVRADGAFALLTRLSKRQAWSIQGIGPGESRGVITIVGQYRSAKQARNRLARVTELLRACPAEVVDGTEVVTQSHRSLPQMYRGRAVATFTVVKDSAGQDSLQYVAIRQTGALLSFVRYSQAFEGRQPRSRQFAGMVDYLSGKVADRYRSLLRS